MFGIIFLLRRAEYDYILFYYESFSLFYSPGFMPAFADDRFMGGEVKDILIVFLTIDVFGLGIQILRMFKL